MSRKCIIDIWLINSTVESCVWLVRSYLRFADINIPKATDFKEFSETLHDKNLSRSQINNHFFAIKKYHEMKSKKIDCLLLKINDDVPRYVDVFSEVAIMCEAF